MMKDAAGGVLKIGLFPPFLLYLIDCLEPNLITWITIVIIDGELCVDDKPFWTHKIKDGEVYEIAYSMSISLVHRPS